MIVAMNASVNYHAGITIVDDTDPDPTYEVDSSQVDLTTPGEYEVYYKAYDKYGNTMEYTRKITVTNESSPTSKVIYLTFDDGPSKNTKEILSILERYNIKATFFITANWPAYANLIVEENNAGHTVALHTYCHVYENIYTSLDAYVNDFKMIQAYAKQYLGYYPTYFRFPGGSSNHVSMNYCEGVVTQIANWANENGYTYFDWNVSSGDGNVATSVSNMISQVQNSPQYDTIVMLCHDSGAATNTVQALPTIIQYYLDRGYTFKAISDNTPECHHAIAN